MLEAGEDRAAEGRPTGQQPQVREKRGENVGKNQGKDKGKGRLQRSYSAGAGRCQRCPEQREPCDQSIILERITLIQYKGEGKRERNRQTDRQTDTWKDPEKGRPV